ncbi:MAG TPA: prepilin peptidase [Kofleriaceae bacterium]|nr:prepilin peptidase [Kofleriaceae bacterium]
MLRELERISTTTGVYAFVVLLGLLWGSFANVCIYRWPPTDEFPKGRSVVRPGSHCFACKTPIRWYDNIPLLSWLWLRGRCRTCRAPFSPRYLIVEAVMGALFGFAWWVSIEQGVWWGESFDLRLVRFAIQAAFCFVMVVIAFIDLDHKLILNKVTVPSIIAFYLLGLLLPERRWYDGLVGAVVGYGVPWAIGELYMLIRGREGLGLGDSDMLAAVGALLGWPGALVSLFGGAMFGAVIGVVALVIAQRRARGQPAPEPAENPAADGADEGEPDPPSLMRTELPFGPFLAMGAVFYLFAEPWIQLKFVSPFG